MKISAVSIYNPKFTSEGKRTDISNPFLYTANQNYKPKNTFKEHKIEYIGGLVAAGLAILSLKKFFGRNMIPQSVVEPKNRQSALNRLIFGGRTTAMIKEKILYPMKAVLMGDKRLLDADMKTGLILADTDEIKLKTYIKAILSHARAIDIHVEEIKYPDKKHRLKEVHKALNNAIAHYKSTGECTIVNIGDLSRISNLKVGKMESCSNIEKRLAETPKGVLWIARTTSCDSLPYFYNNLPTLSLKIVD